jgi:hypothetical protein
MQQLANTELHCAAGCTEGLTRRCCRAFVVLQAAKQSRREAGRVR